MKDLLLLIVKYDLVGIRVKPTLKNSIVTTQKKKILLVFTLFLLSIFLVGFKHDAAEIKISPKLYSALIKDMSEPDGYYQYDNWITNERGYLNIINPLLKNNVKGGAYIGVGPNQNFTFIETIKPEIAFIVDIRQQMTMQHLAYKAMFELAETREEFLSLLLSKSIPGDRKLDKNPDVNDIVDLFYKINSDLNMQKNTTLKIIELLDKKYGFELSQKDKKYIRRMMKIFCLANLNITWNTNENNYLKKNKHVSLAEMLKGTDKSGAQLNIFNSKEKYDYIRKMHLENKIIPITGDFAGDKAFNKISEFLLEKEMTVSALYASSVEWWLFKENKFIPWAKNLAKVPITSSSVIIRQIFEGTNGKHQFKLRLQNINSFMKNYNSGECQCNNDLLYLDYIY